MNPRPPHSLALRKGRYSQSGQIYLITTVTDKRRPLFTDLAMGRLLVQALKGAAPSAQTLAYVIMPDHLHWLMQLAEQGSLAATVQGVKSVSAHRINRSCHQHGAVWQSGYHDHALRRDEDLVKVARYLVANPLRAGLVAHIGDYALWDAVWV